MKKKLGSLASAVVFVLALALPCFAAEEAKKEPTLAGVSIETQAVGNTRPSKVGAWYQPGTKGAFGIFGAAGRWTDGYQYVFGGPTWKPKFAPWLTVGVGIGAEQAALGEGRNIFFRGAGLFGIELGKFSAFGVFEQGGTGPWYKVTVDYKVAGKVSVGALSETNVGVGPRVGYDIGKGYKVWAAVARDWDDRSYTPIFAINYSF